MNKKDNTTVWITKEHKKELKDRANKKDMHLQNYLRELLDKMLK